MRGLGQLYIQHLRLIWGSGDPGLALALRWELMNSRGMNGKISISPVIAAWNRRSSEKVWIGASRRLQIGGPHFFPQERNI
jgi:hypothetical protein